MSNLREFSVKLFAFHKEHSFESLKELCEQTQEFLLANYDQLDESEFAKVCTERQITPKRKKEDIRNRLKVFMDTFVKHVYQCSYDPNEFIDLYNLLFNKNGELKYESCSTILSANMDFYRVRSASEYKLYNASELFVIPEDKKNFVGLNRYNQPGRACLYLASTLYLAWEECRRPDFMTVNFSRFVNKKKVKVLDLTISTSFSKYGNFISSFLALLCSAKTNDSDKFKFQYVVPNLMMSLLLCSQNKNKSSSNRYVGIKYISSRRYDCKDFLFNSPSVADAYVFPQPTDSETAEEDKTFLASLFKMTAPRSYFLYKMHRFNFDNKNARISDYNNSLFHQLEMQLKKEETNEING